METDRRTVACVHVLLHVKIITLGPRLAEIGNASHQAYRNRDRVFTRACICEIRIGN
jgi:hypothetical protein